MNVLYEAYEQNLLEFETLSLNTSQVLWVSNRFPNFSDSKEFFDSFKESFSYGSNLSSCFDEIGFDSSKTKNVSIERYGGYGITKNGGGARCGNIGNFQVKGIGVNILVGKDVSHWYSHGALNVVDAILEATNSMTLTAIFPYGCVSALGIILTGEHSAFFTEGLSEYQPRPCWGALLVRERCIRPAHFMRSMYFESRDEYTDRIPSDVSRIRKSMRVLKQGLKSDQDYVSYLVKFALRSASQFAFAKVARVSHGGLTASNISLDGRWTDLTTVSFMGSCKNHINDIDQHPAFSEHSVVETILHELVYNYSKYCNVTLNPEPLITLYRSAYDSKFHDHCCYIFGINQDDWPKKNENKFTDRLVGIVKELLDFDPTIVRADVDEFNHQDPILLLLKAAYSGEISSVTLSNIERECLESFNVSITEVQVCLSETLATVFSSGESRQKIKDLVITSFKRVYQARHFYRGAMRSDIESILFSGGPDTFRQCIDRYEALVTWIFEMSGKSQNVVFADDKCNISFSVKNNNYLFTRLEDQKKQVFHSLRSIFLGENGVNPNEIDRQYLVEIDKCVGVYA